MAEQVSTRFTPQNKTTHERLSKNTVGLVALSDFRKRRAELVEQQEREAREAALSGNATSGREVTKRCEVAVSESAGGSSVERPKKKKKQDKKDKRQRLGTRLLSFDDEYGEDGGDDGGEKTEETSKQPKKQRGDGPANKAEEAEAAGEASSSHSDEDDVRASRLKANKAVGILPRPVTKAALRKEQMLRETLRREFVALQESIKATEIAIPFVFYDGAHITGGTVRLKKGDFVWVFLDRCRRVGVGRKVGAHGHHRRGWARAGVDDLMLVRDTIIVPHYYDFYYFVMNKILGPGGRRLFDYSAEAPAKADVNTTSPEGLVTSASRAAAVSTLPDLSKLEGASDDPRLTKVVDRRWYARNKHIYPASTWQEFDTAKDYANEIRKDTGGNTFFFSD